MTAASSKCISSQDFWNFKVESLVLFNFLLYSIASEGCGLVTARDLGTISGTNTSPILPTALEVWF